MFLSAVKMSKPSGTRTKRRGERGAIHLAHENAIDVNYLAVRCQICGGGAGVVRLLGLLRDMLGCLHVLH